LYILGSHETSKSRPPTWRGKSKHAITPNHHKPTSGSSAPRGHTDPPIPSAPAPPRGLLRPDIRARGAHGLWFPRPLLHRHASLLPALYGSHERSHNLLSSPPGPSLALPPPPPTSGPHLSPAPPPPPPLAGRQGAEGPVTSLQLRHPPPRPRGADPGRPASRADRSIRLRHRLLGFQRSPSLLAAAGRQPQGSRSPRPRGPGHAPQAGSRSIRHRGIREACPAGGARSRGGGAMASTLTTDRRFAISTPRSRSMQFCFPNCPFAILVS